MTIFNIKQCLIAVAVFTLYLSEAQSTVLLPNPSGPYKVGLNTIKLVDETRLDPFAPDCRPRAVMLSLFYPVNLRSEYNLTCLSEYMPAVTATFEDQKYSPFGLLIGSFEKLSLQVSCKNSSVYHHNDYPVVLFSPALETSRLLYNAIAQSVASSGYIVASIDHPYDADIVEFPDGSFVLGANISSDAQVALAVDTRAQDASFVLNELRKESVAKHLLRGARRGFNVSKVAMFGHSLGGAAAAAAMLNDSRIVGGLDLDGSVYGPVVDQGLDRPFLLWGHQAKNRSMDETWATLWRHLRGWKLELELDGSTHYTFSDFPLVAKVLDLVNGLPPEDKALLGTLDGLRVIEIVGAYVTAFLDFVLRGVNTTLLQKPDPKYPEVTFVP